MNNQPQFISGALRDKQDRRDYRIAGVMAPVTIEKQVFNLEEKFPPNNQWSRGSCFEGNTLITLENFQQVFIKDIKPYQKVITHKSNLREIKRIYKRKWQGNIYDIKIEGLFKHLKVTAEHPIYALKKGQQLLEFIEVKNLEKDDLVVIPTCSEIIKEPINSILKNKDFLCLLGWYLAEGCFEEHSETNNAGGITFTLNSKEIDYADEIIDKIEKVFQKKVDYKILEEVHSLRIAIHSRDIAELFLNLEII